MSQAVITEVVQEMEKLPDDLQRQVLEFTKRLSASVPRGVPGKNLLRFVGTIPADELQQMRQAIEQDCKNEPS